MTPARLGLAKCCVAVAMASCAFSSGRAFATEARLGQLEKLAICEDSWLDWKDDARRTDQYMESFDQAFTRIDDEAAFRPKQASTALGFPVTKVYPQSVGMGVGFSLLLSAPLQQVRSEVEKRVGKPLQCSVEEGMTSCVVELGEQKSLMLASEGNATDESSLLGCYYYYEN